MRQLAMAVTAVLVVLAAAVLAVFLWLRTYTPLGAELPVTPGLNLAADVEPTFGSGGKPVFIPAYEPSRRFEVTLTLANHGRFGVTILGLARRGRSPVRAEWVTPHVRLDPHGTSLVTVRWRLSCPKGIQEAFTDGVRLRYRYLSVFTRTELVELPFAVTLRCSGGP